jgi:hypothetical protein
MFDHVATLWLDPKEGVTFSGSMTLPQPWPAGDTYRVIAVPRPIKGRREKLEIHVQLPLDIPPAPPGPADIIIKGELMSQWFAAPDPVLSRSRSKILVFGESGTGKTKAALSFPACAYMDNHGSAEKYKGAYPQHMFFPPRADILPTCDNVLAATGALLADPGDRLTLVLDDVTTHWDQVQVKWSNIFLTRLVNSKGHHAEFYSFQPGDWPHVKRDLRRLLRRMIAVDMTSIAIARSQNKYAGKGQNFMEVVGTTFAGEKGIVYEFDYVFEFVVEDNKRYAIVHKQRITPGDKPFPEKFEHHIDENGFSDFYQIFCQYVDPARTTAAPHAVDEPGDPEAINEVPAETKTVEETKTVPETTKTIPEGGAPGPGPEAEPLNPIKTEQLDELVQLKAHYKMDNEEWGKTLQKFYAVTTAKALTSDQAAAFIEYLKTKRTPF